MRLSRHALALLPFLLAAAPASAADPAFSLTLQNHKFSPEELTVPANTRVKLTIKNLDPTPAEFESHDFKAEKVIPAGREVSLTIGPLKPGSYAFYDEYHEADAKGRIVVK